MPKTFENAYRLYAKGDFGAARKLLEGHLGATPADPPALFLLGIVDLEEGQLAAGVKRLEAGASGVKPPAILSHRAGRILFDHKDYQGAETWLKRALERNPELAQSHYWLGNTLRFKGDLKGAEHSLIQAIKLAPGEARGYVSLAYLYRETGRPGKAAEVMMALAAKGPKDVAAQEKIAGFLIESGRLIEAEKVLTKLLGQRGEDAPFLVRLGQIRQKLGLFREAGQCYRRAIIRDPSSDAAYLGLSVVKKFASAADPDAVILRQALANEGVSRDALICSHFALGKVHDDCGDYAAAFEHYQKANAMKAEATPFSAGDFRDQVLALKEVFNASLFKRFAGAAPGAPAPIFIVGMLRSGTTLAESVLGAHRAVYAAGELNFIPALAQGLAEAGDGAPYPRYVPALAPETLATAGREYLASVAARAERKPHFTDKNPLNFLHLGLIALMVPGAKVVHCRRNPLDTALSIYFQNFAHEDNAYAYRLTDIAAVMVAYKDLMDHWYKVLPLEIFDLDYENLVKFPERVTQRMLATLGLEWDQACLAFDEHDRAVETASLWQVRQPLYRSSIERWKNYKAHLGPLEKKFKSHGLL